MKRNLIWLGIFSSVVLAQTLPNPSRALTLPEIKAVLSSICESKIDATKGTCFPKKSFYTQIERDPKSQFVLDKKALMGSFSKAATKQVVASGDFMDADGTPERFVAGLSVILENNKVLRVAQDGGSSACMVFGRHDKRDGLICTSESIGQGNLETSIQWRDLGIGAKTIFLLNLVDNTAGGCGDPAKTFTLGKLERRDANNDQIADLIVNLTYKTAPNPNCDIDWTKIQGETFRLVFLWDGKKFNANALTASIIKEKGWK
jgi:hypothetical protein